MIKYIDEMWSSKIKEYVDKGIPPHIRLLSDSSAMTESCRTYICEKYPIVIINSGVATKQEQIVEDVKLDIEALPEITPDNLEELLMPIIKSRILKLNKKMFMKFLSNLKRKDNSHG